MQKKYQKRKSNQPSRRPLRAVMIFIVGFVTGFIADEISYRAHWASLMNWLDTKKSASSEQQETQPKAQSKSPEFEFYHLLPEMEVVIPDNEVITEQTDQKKIYSLQAGSFKRRNEAEQLKAKLALLGLESNVEQISLENKTTWFRVRLGPYTSKRMLEKHQRRMQENGIDSIRTVRNIDKSG